MLLQVVCKQVWLNVKYLVQIVPCMEVAIKMNHLWGTIFDDILPFFEGNCPKKRNISEAIAFEARSLIDSQSSLSDNCEKTRSFFPNDSKKDMPESSSGSCANPILEHLYHENPRNLNAEKSAFGNGMTTIMQGGGGAREKSRSNVSNFRTLQALVVDNN
ncbi:hypothetical protein CMV_021670 [Castanea mollissima]|uniref:Uncharacterized protein n=1 Tax=Castanea mollissima TaxID=60419 RepID=A0A8J4QXQ3_9ROSI|nr:hypothetical protein CMV_021670 [Castanea mollissima]